MEIEQEPLIKQQHLITQIEQVKEQQKLSLNLIKKCNLKSQRNLDDQSELEINVNQQILKLSKRNNFSPSSKQIICASTDSGQIIFYNQADNQVIDIQRPFSQDPITDILWYDNNHLLISDHFTVKLYDIEKKKFVINLEGHSETIQAINHSQYLNTVISGGYDNVILVWDINRLQKPVNCIMAHSFDITCLNYSQDSKFILSTGADGFTRVWDTHTGDSLVTLCQDNETIPTYSYFTKNMKYILQSTLSNQINLWNWKNSNITRSYKGHVNSSTYLSSYFLLNTNQQYKYIISYSEDGYLYVWDIYNNKEYQRFQIEPVDMQDSKSQHSHINKRLYIYENDIDQYNNIILYDQKDFSIEIYQLNQKEDDNIKQK